MRPYRLVFDQAYKLLLGMHIEFCVDMSHMRLYRVVREHELLLNYGACASPGEQFKYFGFACGKPETFCDLRTCLRESLVAVPGGDRWIAA